MALTITQPCRVGTAHHRLAGIARPTRLLSAEDPVTVSIIVTHRLKKEPCMAASSWQWGADTASSYTATHSNFRMGSYISAQCAMANSRSKHGRRQNINSIRGRGGKRPCLLASANPNLQDYGLSNSSNL